MGKDKKKKKIEKQNKNTKIDALEKEYNESLAMLEAKHKQYDGIIREARLYLEEVKKIRDALNGMSTVDNE